MGINGDKCLNVTEMIDRCKFLRLLARGPSSEKMKPKCDMEDLRSGRCDAWASFFLKINSLNQDILPADVCLMNRLSYGQGQEK